MKVKSTVITITLFFSTLVCFGQDISRSIQCSAGASTTSNQGYTVDWTLGAQFSETIKSENHLTEGFQQGDFQKKLTLKKPTVESIVEQQDTIILKIGLSSNISIYPNPTKDDLFLNIIHDNFQGATVLVFDTSGKQVLKQEVGPEDSFKVQINNIEFLSPGHYIIHISNSSSFEAIPFIKI